jgi:hypothetical protein
LDCSEDTYTEKVIISNTMCDSSITTIKLPINNGSRTLGPGNTTLIPVWIRIVKPGSHKFFLVFHFGSDTTNDFRIQRLFLAAQVSPTFRMNAFIRPSLSNIQDFVVGVELENLQQTAELSVRQFSCISPSWKLEPLSER